MSALLIAERDAKKKNIATVKLSESPNSVMRRVARTVEASRSESNPETVNYSRMHYRHNRS